MNSRLCSYSYTFGVLVPEPLGRPRPFLAGEGAAAAAAEESPAAESFTNHHDSYHINSPAP